MIIPDPWFENVLEDESRFVAQDCRFIEIWQQKDGEVSTQTGILRAEEIEDWVKENGNYRRQSSTSSGGFRLLIASNLDKYKYHVHKWPFSRSTAKVVFEEFNLMTTLLQACSTGNRAMVVCKSQIAAQGICAWVVRQLLHAAALSYCVHTNSVRGLVFAERTNTQPLIDSILAYKQYACHPMLVPFSILTLEMGRLIDRRERDNRKTLELEEKIGLRRDWTTDENFLKQTESAMRQVLESLTMITNHKADTEIVASSFMDAISRSIELVKQQVLSIKDGAVREQMELQCLDLEYRIEYLYQSNTSISASFGALQKRVEAQMTGLYTLLGQRDSKLNLAMAHDSRRLASASKRDSSSMKTIAVLTTVFLPGTFIATVFSMPMVDYPPSKFWIYLAIAIPLTIAVMAFWAIWMFWINKQNEKEDMKASKHLPMYDEDDTEAMKGHPDISLLKRLFCQE